MTREEAIKIINNFPVESTEEREAVVLSIEALEQEPCEDCVSLRDVIHTIDWWVFYREPDCRQLVIWLKERINELPPVTPKQKMGRWITHWNTAHQKEYYYCSECREEFSYDGETGIKMNGYTFCPNCGSYNGGNSNVNE